MGSHLFVTQRPLEVSFGATRVRGAGQRGLLPHLQEQEQEQEQEQDQEQEHYLWFRRCDSDDGVPGREGDGQLDSAYDGGGGGLVGGPALQHRPIVLPPRGQGQLGADEGSAGALLPGDALLLQGASPPPGQGGQRVAGEGRALHLGEGDCNTLDWTGGNLTRL